MNLKHILTMIKFHKFFALVIILQVTLSMSVVSNSFFLGLKVYKEWSLAEGIVPEELITISAKTYQPGANFQSLLTEDLDELSKIKGVKGVTPINLTPIAAGWPNTIYDSEGENKTSLQTHIFNVDSNGLNVLGLKLIEGRNFNSIDVKYSDGSEQPNVVMLSEAMAEELFSDSDAIGKTIWLAEDSSPVEVIGIYSNFISSQFLAAKGMPYRSILQPKVVWHRENAQSYIIRVEPGTAGSVKNAISDHYAQIVGRTGGRPDSLADVKWQVFFERVGTFLMYMTISALLLIITFCGLIGLINFIVSTRKGQIATRRALGAKVSRIIWEFITENMVITVVGILFGLLFTVVISSMFREFNGLVAADLVYALVVAVVICLLNAIAVTISVRKTVKRQPSELLI
ncbi:FtsX-like permease family protein [Pseudoalteromonas sp. A22]|uniref:ABC transporter permease n=1 Tax=Pseudoalteromonas TaxID=53246 RepID=UPI001BA48CDE|nr:MULTISPECIES: ABC transporter permease [Pseudoalteromonas]QUI61465.1 FtsX-like permease family protein [Pseudoalteromonas sp. A22]USE71056.1 hypothetical protein CTT31_18285 [Pseudoalteromonas flavipulchra]